MKASRLLLCCIAIIIGTVAHAQQMRAYTPVIEPCACPVQVDSSFKTQCGYLVVPENRYKHNSKTVKLPFIVVKSNNPAKRKDPLLFTSGGPGGSSLGWVRGITRHNVIQNRDCIAFEQRGTRYAIPNLWGPELDDAIREAYRKNLPKDSMVLAGVQRYKKALQAKGIDLSGYNTDETVEDIEDLLKTLQIDSVNLLGGSYSGGLMMAVLRRDSARVRSLLLDCPLPTFIPIDQDEPANFNEALKALSLHCAKDSANRERYGNLMEKFQAYFSSIGHQSFYIPYVEKGTTDTLHIRYTRNELLDVVENALQDHARLKEAPFIITELTRGHHYPYIKTCLMAFLMAAHLQACASPYTAQIKQLTMKKPSCSSSTRPILIWRAIISMMYTKRSAIAGRCPPLKPVPSNRFILPNQPCSAVVKWTLPAGPCTLT